MPYGPSTDQNIISLPVSVCVCMFISYTISLRGHEETFGVIIDAITHLTRSQARVIRLCPTCLGCKMFSFFSHNIRSIIGQHQQQQTMVCDVSWKLVNYMMRGIPLSHYPSRPAQLFQVWAQLTRLDSCTHFLGPSATFVRFLSWTFLNWLVPSLTMKL